MGLYQKRDRSQLYDDLIDEFMKAITDRYSVKLVVMKEPLLRRGEGTILLFSFVSREHVSGEGLNRGNFFMPTDTCWHKMVPLLCVAGWDHVTSRRKSALASPKLSVRSSHKPSVAELTPSTPPERSCIFDVLPGLTLWGLFVCFWRCVHVYFGVNVEARGHLCRVSSLHLPLCGLNSGFFVG